MPERGAALIRGGGPSGIAQTGAGLTKEVASIKTRYPALKGIGYVASWGSSRTSNGGQLEFFHPLERGGPGGQGANPLPGVPFIEVYNRNLRGEWLERAIFGDMLHYLPEVDPKFNRMREEFRKTLTPEQNKMDQTAYKNRKAGGENRSYDEWFEASQLDAYLRGYLAPDERNDWRNAYTPTQRDLLERMRTHLETPKGRGATLIEGVR